MGHEQWYKWIWCHTLTQNLKVQFYGSSPHLNSVQLLYFYLMWDFTSHLYSNNPSFKCESLPHSSHFQSTSIFMVVITLESTCSRYLYHRSTHETRRLDPPSERLLIQWILRPMIHHCYLIHLSRSPSQTIDSDINCCALEEDKYQEKTRKLIGVNFFGVYPPPM